MAIPDIAYTQQLIDLAGHSPCAEYVSPASEVCTTNQQTLSHAINALAVGDFESAEREALKLSVRRGTKMEKQIATVANAIATSNCIAVEIDAMLFFHDKIARQTGNKTDSDFYLCLPAIGLANIALHFGRLERDELDHSNVYCPADLLVNNGE